MDPSSLPRACWHHARQVFRASTSFSREVVRAARRWVTMPTSRHAYDFSTSLGIVIAEPAARLRRRLPSVRKCAEKLVVHKQVDTLVDEWCSGIPNPDIVEVGWALRLRDRFGLPPASEPTRLSGERWVLKQLNGVDPESWNADLGRSVHIQGDYAPGRNAHIAQVAATLWLTRTLHDKALARHQGFSRFAVIGVDGLEAKAVPLASGLRLLPVPRPGQSRRLSQTLLLPTPRAQFVNHACSANNLGRVMTTRVLQYKGRDPILPSSEALHRLNLRIAELYRSRPSTVYPLSYEGFLNCYEGRQRTRYAQAVEQLMRSTLEPKDARVETFIKNEKFDWALKGEEADPRAIQPRKPKYLAEVGRWFKPLERIIYKDLSKRLYGEGAEPCIAKGLNALESGATLRRKWEKFSSPVCVSLDASRFDLHVSVGMLKFTHKLYDYYCKSPTLQRYLKWTLRNHGVASCKELSYEYEVVGRRMSGDMDTALGNCVIMSILTWFMLSELGIKHELFDNGDDCLFICESHDVPSPEVITNWFSDFGFVVRLEGVTSVFERIEFCQTSPVWTERGWLMCRNIKSLSKDLTNVNSCTGSTIEYTHWLKAVGKCGSILNAGVPIFQSFHNMLERLGTNSRIDRGVFFKSGLVNLIRGMDRQPDVDITTSARLSFEVAFGITPGMQLAIERYYDSVMGSLSKIETTKWPIELRKEYEHGSEWYEDLGVLG
ncbi:RNA-dependent RNA polymerase [Citrus yellow vein-associated virus]|uniref:RNA-dependent RNA polymerase n=1 Tax=Citrus yellow vein-associated virus TaxID=1297894 RepID=UPI0003846AFE|nr:RNA-dependent RNA polymerase [Citrus yellow vein-associated virus]AGG23390.1 RNA-dependent RNA polymerase [Citrus yellow vein-associated virus]